MLSVWRARTFSISLPSYAEVKESSTCYGSRKANTQYQQQQLQQQQLQQQIAIVKKKVLSQCEDNRIIIILRALFGIRMPTTNASPLHIKQLSKPVPPNSSQQKIQSTIKHHRYV